MFRGMVVSGFLIQAIVISIILFIVFIVLQIFISRSKNKWYGMIIPLMYFCVAIVVSVITGVNGGTFAAFLYPFLLLNIPTMIFMIIYAICRENIKIKKTEIAQLNIENI